MSSTIADRSAEVPSWLYFFAGALLPTLALYFRKPVLNGSHDSDDEGEDEDLIGIPPDGPCASWGFKHAPYKMILCVNQGLGMGKGKIAAQCCHAAVGCYKRSLKQCPAALRAWEYSGCAKIALKCPNEEAMEDVAARAQAKGIPMYLVEDAGRTQIAAGSRTVLGLFGPASIFEGVSDHLKLM